jgi:ubiquinone biosynthesis accessory factor UbiJ
MRWPDPAEAPARLANRMLAGQDWARDQLTPFAGRVFSFAVGPVSGSWLVAADGTLATAAGTAPPDLSLSMSPWSVPAFLADPTRWNEFVRETGDAEFGGALKDLARTLPWFVEETFAKMLGPIVGQRVADAGRKLLAFPEYAAQRAAESAGSYARDEAGLIARGSDFRRWQEEVAAVGARVDALAARVEALAPRVRPIR